MRRGSVCLGATLWTEPHWQEGLYPSDLPADWRLAYYNTQFDCVWLAYPTWHEACPEDARQWMEDTRSEFRFLLEAGADEDAGDAEIRSILATRLAAHCAADHPDLLWFDARSNLRGLTAELQARVASGRTTWLLSRDGNLATIERLRTLLGLLDFGYGDGVG